MWSGTNRARYDRGRLRYPSDLTDAEWAVIAPLIPGAKRGGNKRRVDVREIANGLLYILRVCLESHAERATRRSRMMTEAA